MSEPVPPNDQGLDHSPTTAPSEPLESPVAESATEASSEIPVTEAAAETIADPEAEVKPESPERAQATKVALDKLVEAAKESAHPFNRPMSRIVYKFDPKAIDPENGHQGHIVGSFEDIEPVHKDLRSIDLRTYPDQESDAAYVLTLSFPGGDLGGVDGESQPKQLMLSLESPRDINLWSRFDLTEEMSYGVTPQGRRMQDFLYVDGATTVPVRETDLLYAGTYRPDGHAATYDATTPQMDVILKILANANINDREGAKVTDLVPELADLVEQRAA